MRSSPDPPYADIGIYGELARVARPALKDDGVLVAMCTPENLADVLAAMTPHLNYVSTMALVFNGQGRAQIWKSKMNEMWRPLVVFGHVRHWGASLLQCPPQTANDKAFHHWGQSTGAMRLIVERFTRPGDFVVERF